MSLEKAAKHASSPAALMMGSVRGSLAAQGMTESLMNIVQQVCGKCAKKCVHVFGCICDVCVCMYVCMYTYNCGVMGCVR